MNEPAVVAAALAAERIAASGSPVADAPLLPEGVLVARLGAGANCSSAGSAIDILFYTSVIAGAVAVALSAAFPPRPAGPAAGREDDRANEPPSGDDPKHELR